MTAIRDALAELVACKALQDAADAIHDGLATAEQWGDKLRMVAEYERRMPLAWIAAHAALAQKIAPADELVHNALVWLRGSPRNLRSNAVADTLECAIETLRAELAQVMRELAGAREARTFQRQRAESAETDALRYRWLRVELGNFIDALPRFDQRPLIPLYGPLDDAIDVAREIHEDQID